ncbi:DUF6625 family protein [Dysgonomonas termitidis]|uniref:DUF6625 family protein n=1 Tax=Dysgonomonas termitidis TaxID=1516126 RepID=A0ABV9KYL0_9BACT
MKNNSIAFLILYIGDYPWYFSYFLHSCKYNPNIDFYIYTDNPIIESSTPENVKLIPYSLNEFNKDAAKALGFPVNIEHGYKLCDFKPAYGYIFADLVKNYDFWGHCDIDIIFGNIRNFVTDAVLSKYDVISARHDYLTGSFALYRNGLFNNALFKQSKDYIKVFTSSENFCFDETNYAFKAFEIGLHRSEIKTEVESMTHVVKRLEEKRKLKPYFEFQILEGLAGNMLWDNGTLTYRKEFEVMYYHLIKLKTVYSEKNIQNRVVPNKFRIGKKKIYY